MVHGKRKAEKRPPRALTAQRLNAIALRHLERYASSAENLRRVLQRRVDKAARLHDDPGQAMNSGETQVWIEELIGRFVDIGLLNDRLYAQNRARALLAQGVSTYLIRLKLREKGLCVDDIEAALERLFTEHGEPDMIAAVKRAKRRRLGPYGDPAKRRERYDRDMAALARAGFSYAVAKRVIETQDADTLNALLGPQTLI